MTKREQELLRQLDHASERIARLERAQVVVVNTPPARNSLQTISDWWHGGASQDARTRNMRVNC
jgi:hypothetical protein